MSSSRCREHARLLIAIFFVLHGTPAIGSDVDPGWRQRLETEAPAAWERYRQANRFAQGVSRGEYQIDNAPSVRQEVARKCNETCSLIQVTDLNTGKSTIYGRNAKYWFHLKSGQDGAWTLADLVMADQSAGDKHHEIKRHIEMHSMGEIAVKLPCIGKSRPLGELLQSARTRITAVGLKPHAGKQLIEVRFDYAPASADDALRGGTLLLDPERDWLPAMTVTFTKNRAGIGTITAEFDLPPGAHPLPARFLSRDEYNVQPEPVRIRSEWNLGLQRVDPLPVTAEFTLSAFGLPEPVGVTWEKPTPRYVWFLIAAGGCATFAVFFRWLARRRRASKTSPPPAVS